MPSNDPRILFLINVVVDKAEWVQITECNYVSYRYLIAGQIIIRCQSLLEKLESFLCSRDVVFKLLVGEYLTQDYGSVHFFEDVSATLVPKVLMVRVQILIDFCTHVQIRRIPVISLDLMPPWVSQIPHDSMALIDIENLSRGLIHFLNCRHLALWIDLYVLVIFVLQSAHGHILDLKLELCRLQKAQEHSSGRATHIKVE